MNWRAIGLWGLAGTLALSTVSGIGQGLGISRIDLPFLLGTMVTPNRDRAKLIGFFMHLFNGWWLAALYAFYFRSMRMATWWLGMGMGLAHGLFVLVAILPVVPGLHPRMVSDYAGPEPTRQLEPPGFMALNYGRRTPLAILLAHAVYGATLGTFFRLR